MPSLTAAVDLVVNGEVLRVLTLPLGALPVLNALWRVLESGTADVLRELRGFVADWRVAMRTGFHCFTSFPFQIVATPLLYVARCLDPCVTTT